MAAIAIAGSEYIPHPEGQHKGHIKETENKGQVETKFGAKPKLVLKIENSDALTDDGTPFGVHLWLTISSHPESNLRKLRETLLGRKLTREEIRTLIPEAELVGRHIGYSVVHREAQDGAVFANRPEAAETRSSLSGEPGDAAGWRETIIP